MEIKNILHRNVMYSNSLNSQDFPNLSLPAPSSWSGLHLLENCLGPHFLPSKSCRGDRWEWALLTRCWPCGPTAVSEQASQNAGSTCCHGNRITYTHHIQTSDPPATAWKELTLSFSAPRTSSCFQRGSLRKYLSYQPCF